MARRGQIPGRDRGDDRNDNAPADNGEASRRQLVVITDPAIGLRASTARVTSARGVDISPLAALVASEGVALVPLFGMSEERILARTAAISAAGGQELPDLSIYYQVEAPDDQLDDLAERLRQTDGVAAAYVKPPTELPQALPALNDMLPQGVDAPPVTPDFTARQGYLDAAPGGIDARFAWGRAGGGGTGVRIVDVEGAWRFSHEDLLANQGGVAGGVASADIAWRNHGTAVIGEFGGDRGAPGVTGICPEANVRAVSIFTNAAGSANSAAAIRQAADLLSPGDILLIELHRPGPRFNFASRNDQRGYIAVEWWPDDFDAIRYANGRGVIVVEAAGNGAEDLDDPLYNARPAGFPATWTNPFNRANRDSRAIVVGAGAPPSGNFGPDRSRLDFSNFGALIDAQGWGREVVTTGYGDLQGGTNEDEWYTERFSGTSSASPIVVGALGCIQGAVRAAGRPALTPAQARQLLRDTGSPQQAAPGRPVSQRIGNRPNLRQAIPRVTKSTVKEILKDFKEVKQEKQEKQEIKEGKSEKAEIKEVKQEKIEVKEGKPEIKELKQEKIEIKEGKQEKAEIKEIIIEKNPLENKPREEKLVEGGLGGGVPFADLRPWGGVPGAEEAAIFAPRPRFCVDLRNLSPGSGTNPLTMPGMTFTVYDHTGNPQPNSHVSSWGGFTGLNVGFGLDIALASPCRAIEATLVHFAQPATVSAFNINGTLAGTATMSGPQRAVETLTIQGAAINHVIIHAPKDETLLLRLCCLSGVKPLKREIKELKDKEKEIREGPAGGTGGPYADGGVEQRLADLEATITRLVHFISPALRPDLGAGALTGEADLGGADLTGLSQQLQQQALDAKANKDSKDIEKLGES